MDLVEQKLAETTIASSGPPAPDPSPLAPAAPVVVPARRKVPGTAGPRRGRHEKEAVLAAMGPGGLVRFARDLGLRFVGSRPGPEGWWKCRAIDRDDADPSANFSERTGYYVDHGPSEAKLSIFELATRLAGGEYPDVCSAIDKLGDIHLGEPRAERPARPPVAGPADSTSDSSSGEVEAGPDLAIASVRARILDLVAQKDLSRLYGDAGLLVDLASVERADPAAFASLKVGLSGLRGFREKAFSAALAQHRPPGQAASDEEGKGSDVARLVELGGEGIELFQDSGHKPYALIRAGSRLETLPLRGSAYKNLLKGRFFDQTGSTPGAEAFRSSLDVLELHALKGAVHEVSLRIAEAADPADEHNAAVYLDLADQDRRAVRITRAGWEVIPESSARFRRPPGMLPLPEPRKGGSLDDLWQFANVREADRPLVVAWMTAALRQHGPYPILILNGEQGTAKSSTSNAIRRTIDPHVTPLRGAPKDDRELMIVASNTRILAFDNLSYLPDWLSDGLCRISTGSGYSCRQLYTDDEEVFLVACRPILFNGIEEIAVRGDLLQRSIVLELPVIPDEGRKPEKRFWIDYREAHPMILGALLDVMAGGLAALPGVRLDGLPRMADFALWGEAVGRAMGRPAGDFLAAYAKNEEKAVEIALEGSPVGMAVIALMARRPEWTGTAQGLLAELEDQVTASARRRNWPASPRGLSGALRRAAPALRSMGIVAEFVLAGDRQKTRTIKLKSAPSPGPAGSPE